MYKLLQLDFQLWVLAWFFPRHEFWFSSLYTHLQHILIGHSEIFFLKTREKTFFKSLPFDFEIEPSDKILSISQYQSHHRNLTLRHRLHLQSFFVIHIEQEWLTILPHLELFIKVSTNRSIFKPWSESTGRGYLPLAWSCALHCIFIVSLRRKDLRKGWRFMENIRFE